MNPVEMALAPAVEATLTRLVRLARRASSDAGAREVLELAYRYGFNDGQLQGGVEMAQVVTGRQETHLSRPPRSEVPPLPMECVP